MGDQLQPGDTLDDRGAGDILDEGYSPPDRASASMRREWRSGDDELTMDEKLAEEEPDPLSTLSYDIDDAAENDDDESWSEDAADDWADEEIGDRRSGRLVDPDLGLGEDRESSMVGTDVGIDGAGASAEEAAVHVIDERDLEG